MSFQKKFILLFNLNLLFVSVSCQTDNAGYESKIQGEESRTKDGVEPPKASLDLWSPTKRKSNASYYFLLGEYESLNRNLPKARLFFENAYNLDPNSFTGAKFIEARANEDLDEALTLAKKMVLLYPENAPILAIYGKLTSSTGDLDKALVYLNQAIAIEPQNIDFQSFSMQILILQKQYNEAIEVAAKILKINPDFADIWSQLSKLYIRTKQPHKALEAAQKSYDLSSSDAEKVHLYASILEYIGDAKKAAELYDSLVVLDPSNDNLHAQIIATYRNLGSVENALVRLKVTEGKLGRESPGINLMRAFCLWELQRFEEASALLDNLALMFPQSEKIVYMAGLGQERVRNHDKAIQTFKSLDSSSDLFAAARFRVIDLLRQNGEIEKAINECLEVINSSTDGAPNFYPLLSNLLNLNKRFSDSIAYLNEGYRKFPSRTDFLFNKAVTLEKMGDIDECINVLEDLIRIEPRDAAALNFLGYLFVEKGVRLAEAEKLISMALEIRPDDGYYLDSLGWLYFKRGEYSRALDLLLKANDFAENEAVILEHIAETLIKLDRKSEAFRYLEKAINGKGEELDLLRIKEKYEKFRKKNPDFG